MAWSLDRFSRVRFRFLPKVERGIQTVFSDILGLGRVLLETHLFGKPAIEALGRKIELEF